MRATRAPKCATCRRDTSRPHLPGCSCKCPLFSSCLRPSSLNRLCLELAPAALGLIFFYSFTKRFTSLSHLVLGLCLGIAPAAAWIAMQGSLDARILLLTAAVTFWTAGFDVIYSCQDYAFDCAEGLWSVPRVWRSEERRVRKE